MRKFTVFVCGIIIFSAFSTIQKAAVLNGGGRPLHADLDFWNERPAPCFTESDASGSFKMTVNPGKGIITYELTVENIDAVTAAHIHPGTSEEVKPPIIHLLAPTDGSSSGEIEIDRELAKDIMKNPGNYYVNVHSQTCPAGAVRGQLSK